MSYEYVFFSVHFWVWYMIINLSYGLFITVFFRLFRRCISNLNPIPQTPWKYSVAFVASACYRSYIYHPLRASAEQRRASVRRGGASLVLYLVYDVSVSRKKWGIVDIISSDMWCDVMWHIMNITWLDSGYSFCIYYIGGCYDWWYKRCTLSDGKWSNHIMWYGQIQLVSSAQPF